MNEGKQYGEDGEEAGETAAAKETEDISKKKAWKSEDSPRTGGEVHPKQRNND